MEIAIKGFFSKISPEQQVFLEELERYVFERICLLQNEIDAEETVSPQSATVIYLMEQPRAIQPRGYSQELCDKIIGSFNEKDSQLMLNKAFEAVQGLLN